MEPSHDWPASMVVALLRDGSAVRFVARGNSMWPLVVNGSCLEVDPGRPDEARVGELVAFEGARGVVIHRLVGRTGDHLICQGDAHARPDPPVSPGRYLGRARVVRQPRRKLRWPTRQRWAGLPRSLARAGRAVLRLAQLRAAARASYPTPGTALTPEFGSSEPNSGRKRDRQV